MDLDERPSPPTLSYEPVTRTRPRESALRLVLACVTVFFGLILIAVFLPFVLGLWGSFAGVPQGVSSVKPFVRAFGSTCLFAGTFWAVCRAINVLTAFDRE